MIDVAEALERGLAGIAGGRDQNADGLLLAGLLQGRGQQIRQHLQRHILERARRPVPELLHPDAFFGVYDRRGCRSVELLRAVGLFGKAEQLLLGKFVQIQLHELRRALRIRQLCKRFDLREGDLRNTFRQIQAAVAAEAFNNGFAGRQTASSVSCAYIMHVVTTFRRELQNRFCMVSSEYPVFSR